MCLRSVKYVPSLHQTHAIARSHTCLGLIEHGLGVAVIVMSQNVITQRVERHLRSLKSVPPIQQYGIADFAYQHNVAFPRRCVVVYKTVLVKSLLGAGGPNTQHDSVNLD